MTAGLRSPTTVADYYRDAHVRDAMLQYCGQTDTTAPSAVFLTGLRAGSCPIPTWEHDGHRVPVSAIAELWDGGYDIARSLWDHRHLVFLLELDYQNPDAPGEPFFHPADVFLKLEPAYRAVRRVLARRGLRPAVVMTGRGYQFTGVVPLDDPLVARLAALSATPSWHDTLPARWPAEIAATMTPAHARAVEGLGRLVEYAAQLVFRDASPESRVPVVLNGTTVGAGLVGREAVSIDISHVGDPVDVRHARAAFSAYQFHHLRPDIVGPAISQAVPPLVALPRRRQPLMAMLSSGRSFAAGLDLSRRHPASLPDVTAGVAELLRHYEASSLAAFHREFYRTPTPAGRDVRLAALPPCAAAALDQPNDRLLKPEHLQHVVRVLLARGWDPASIAALVRRKYEEDHQWADRWTRMDPRSRAEFDVRVFAGLIATGLDSLVDFNCVSSQEKQLCPRLECRFDLRIDRERLQKRLAH